MCSNAPEGEPAGADMATRLGEAIDELAAAISETDPGDPQLAARLAGAWAMITSADPELKARITRYSSS
jgi:hypothetical protein